MKLTLNQLKIIVDAMDHYERFVKINYPHNMQEFLNVKNRVIESYESQSLIEDRLRESNAIEAADLVEWSFDEEEDD